MRRVLAVLAALCLATGGCSASQVDPDATVRISGRALDAAGRPLADTEVLLLKEADLGEVVLGTVLAAGTLSTVCLLPNPPPICADARTTTTGADGRYEFELRGSDTQGTLGTESTLDVVFGGARGSTTVRFAARDTEVRVPDARLWRARPALPPPGGPIRLSWSPLPTGAGEDVGYSTLLLEQGSEAAAWSQPAFGTESAVDPRILEDRDASVAVGATASLPGGRGTGDVHVSYLSARLPVLATAGAPRSRGRPCAPVTGPRARLGAPATDCPMTDGDLAAPARLDAGGGVVSGVVVDLGSVRPVRLVVVRGFAGQIVVEASADGHRFQRVGVETGTAVAVAPASPPSARYVRVRSPAGVDESLAAEVSVW